MGTCGSQESKSRGLIPNSSSTLGNSHDSNRIQLTSPLKMPMSNTYKCSRCGMVFPTDEALFKHRTRFCIGIMSEGTGRKLYYSDDEDINQLTSRTVGKHQSPVDKKRDEISEWKNQRSVLQSVQDMEDRILRDSQKTDRLANDLKKRTYDYNQILVEYERLQTQEQDLLRQMFNLQGQSGLYGNQSNGLHDHERSQLEILQRQNARLEQERRIIQNKLEELIASDHQPTNISNYEPYRLLRDMKEEQDRNEKSLIHLRRRLAYSDSARLSLPYLNSPRRTIVSDVRPLRNGYLYSGGQDTDDLDRRLRQYEYYPWSKSFPEPLRHYRYRPIETAADRLINTQLENERLQNDLDNMERRFQKLDSRTRQLELTVGSSGTFDYKPNSYPSLTVNRYEPIRSFSNTSTRPIQTNHDNEGLDRHRQYYQSTLPSLDRHITSHVTQSTNHVNPNMSKLRDPLAPQPYDPTAGFVIFFDFIIKLPLTTDQCRLITCLHHPDSGLGEPSQLRPIRCEVFVDETTGERINAALIATKQPVPSCPSQQSLTIIIEIQITSKEAPNQILRTNAWIKLPLFDHRNRLISGRWKVPLKSLPIYQNENFMVINTLPSYARAELYYRLVNPPDAFEQSTVPLSPMSRDLYFYPPQYRNGSYM